MKIEKVLLIGSQESYNYLKANELLEQDKLYFCIDTKNLYKGKSLYTDAVRRVINRPEDPKNIAVGKIYYICSTNTLEYYDAELRKWIVLRPKIVSGIEVERRPIKDESGKVMEDSLGRIIEEEYISDEYVDTIPTSLAVYNLVKTQIDKNNNSGKVVTALTNSKEAGVIEVHSGDNVYNNVTLGGLLMRPHKVYTVNGKLLYTDDKGLIETQEVDGNVYDEKGKLIEVHPNVTKYKLKDGTWESGYLIEQVVYPITGDTEPFMTPDIHADPNNPNNGFNSKKSRYEIYLTDGNKIILPIGGTIGEVGTGDDAAYEPSQLPNYTKFVNIVGGETPTAKNQSKRGVGDITINTNVKISSHPNNSLYVDGYDPNESREEDEESEESREGKLTWVSETKHVHFVDICNKKIFYYNGSLMSNDLSDRQRYTDLNKVSYDVRFLSEYDNNLCVTWTDNIYVNDVDNGIFDVDSDDTDHEGGEEIDETDEDDDSEESEPDDETEIDETDPDDDDEEYDDREHNEEKEPPKGTPFAVVHFYRAGVDSRTSGDRTACHCFKPVNMPRETDPSDSAKELLFYYTYDNMEVYKYYFKTVRTPQTPDPTTGNPRPDIINHYSNSVRVEEAVNSQIFNYFSLDRFEYADTNYYEDEITYDNTGLMVDLTPYTKLTLFWREINGLKDEIVKIYNEINKLHDLIKIEEF